MAILKISAMARSTLILCMSLGAVHALPWLGAMPTKSPTATADWTPAPTSEADSNLNFLELLKRDLFSEKRACGWIRLATTDLIVTCSTQSSCAFNTDVSLAGCCANGGACTFYTACVDGRTTRTGGDRSDVYTCPGTAVCYQNTYPNGYKQYGCGAANAATTIVTSIPGAGAVQIAVTGNAVATTTTTQPPPTTTSTQPPTTAPTTTTPPTTTSTTQRTTTSQQQDVPISSSATSNPTRLSTSVVTSPNERTSSQMMTIISSTSSVPRDAVTSPTTSSTSTATVTPVPGGSGLSTGASAGIGAGVGGAALLGLGVLFFFCRKRRRNNEEREEVQTGIHAYPAVGTAAYGHQVEKQPQVQATAAEQHYPPSYEPMVEKFGTPIQTKAEVYGSPVSAHGFSAPDSMRSSTIAPPSATTTDFSNIYELDPNSDRIGVAPGPRYEMSETSEHSPASRAQSPVVGGSETGAAGAGVARSPTQSERDEQELARLRKDIERVRAEKERLGRMRELDTVEEELKEKIMQAQRQSMGF